uniref:Uncharacterized protein P0587F01.16 n=1 Tax=Oryza sativa subsp. japonica TaxID=39947 RepID=C1AR07_ORYSJ|nr:hypothetical protein [Oryza sativa Japonica Group]
MWGAPQPGGERLLAPLGRPPTPINRNRVDLHRQYQQPTERRREAVIGGGCKGEGEGEYGGSGVERRTTAQASSCDWSAMEARVCDDCGKVGRRRRRSMARRRRWRKSVHGSGGRRVAVQAVGGDGGGAYACP